VHIECQFCNSESHFKVVNASLHSLLGALKVGGV
jgi:hypothetical protein